MMLPMPGRVRAALKLYLNQEPRRSLHQLAAECAQHGVKASAPTLKRWSSRYRWQDHVAEHDHVVAEESMAQTVGHHVQAMQVFFKLIDAAKGRYEWLIDPNNPNVTPAQRKQGHDNHDAF